MSNIITKHIPNTLTSCNLLCGCVAIVLALSGSYLWAAYAIMASAVFDFFDGFAARWLKAYSPIGKELDSLADVVSFGVAPALMVFHRLTQLEYTTHLPSLLGNLLPYTALLIAVFSALRLAKFNIDERQTTSFVGLNTPANALFWISSMNCEGIYQISPFVIVAVIFLFCWLLVSEIPMFSLKFSSFNLKKDYPPILLLVFGIVLVSFFGIAGFAPTVVIYLLLSLLQNYQTKIG